MTCPQEPLPNGWRVWRNAAVPTPLEQAAIDIRDHVRQYRRGSIARTMLYGGQAVGFWVSSHTWTYRNGELVTGICIPGVSILVSVPAGTQGPGGTYPDDLQSPDPSAAVYGADDVPGTDWATVVVSALAGATLVGLFVAAIKFAGKP